MPKKKKHRKLYKILKPFIKDSRVTFGMLGAVGVGVALASALGPGKAGDLLERITGALQDLNKKHLEINQRNKKGDEGAHQTEIEEKPVRKKPSKPFAIEDI